MYKQLYNISIYYIPNSIVSHLDSLVLFIIMKQYNSSALIQLHCLNTNRREHVLKRRPHQLNVIFLGVIKIMKYNQGR